MAFRFFKVISVMRKPTMSHQDKSLCGTALSLFRAGASKSEIARAIGRDKKQVGRILAEAIKGIGHGR